MNMGRYSLCILSLFICFYYCGSLKVKNKEELSVSTAVTIDLGGKTNSIVADESASTSHAAITIDMKSIGSLDDGGSIAEENYNITEGQRKINKIITAFSRLPDKELSRLDVDIKAIITEGSIEAEKLFKAWETRQKELKEAMKDLLNAAEYMKSILDILRSGNSTDAVKIASLLELEDLLSDIDNAKDFHTIGGWPTLASLLIPPEVLSSPNTNSSSSIELQTVAAWAVGSAVKNSYDYQLWTIDSLLIGDENSGQQVTVIQLLVDIIRLYNSKESPTYDLESEDDKEQELLKKALFAVSAAARGNVDVQNALLVKNSDNHNNETDKLSSILLDSLYNISINTNRTHTDVMRKIWSFVYDLLEERQYIREELTPAASPEDAAVLKELSLLGDCLLSEKWANLAVFVLFKYFQEFSYLQKMKKEELLMMVIGNEKKRYIAIHATLRSILQCIRLYAEYAKMYFPSPSHIPRHGKDENVINTQDLFSSMTSMEWEQPPQLEVKETSLHFYHSVKASLVSLLNTIDVSLAEDETFVDVVTEVRDVLQLL